MPRPSPPQAGQDSPLPIPPTLRALVPVLLGLGGDQGQSLTSFGQADLVFVCV